MSILKELVGHRIVAIYGGQAVVARLDDLDEKFVKISLELPKRFAGEISKRQPTYVNLENIDSILDAEDEDVFKTVLKQMQEAQEQQMRAMMAAQGRRPPNGATPNMKLHTSEDAAPESPQVE